MVRRRSCEEGSTVGIQIFNRIDWPEYPVERLKFEGHGGGTTSSIIMQLSIVTAIELLANLEWKEWEWLEWFSALTERGEYHIIIRVVPLPTSEYALELLYILSLLPRKKPLTSCP